FSPACVVKLGPPVELGTNLLNVRSDSQEDFVATLTAKTVPIPSGRSGFGLAIAGAVVLDPLNHTGNGMIVNIPATFEFSKELRVNLNAGAQYYSGGDTPGLFATAGAGVSWDFAQQWSTLSQVLRPEGPRPNQSALPKRRALQPHEGHRLRSHLRSQPRRRSRQLDYRGADRADRRQLTGVLGRSGLTPNTRPASGAAGRMTRCHPSQ